MATEFFKVSRKMYDAILSDNVNHKTIKLYLFMLKRANITKLVDIKGDKYFIVTREEMKKVLKTTFLKEMTDSIKKLEEIEVIKVIREKGKASKYYWLEK